VSNRGRKSAFRIPHFAFETVTYDSTQQPNGWVLHRVGQGILVEGGKVLLAGNRWYSDRPPVWTLPGGRAEEGEGTGEALLREFREETGLEIEPLKLAYVAESRSVVRRQIFIVCAFAVRRLGGELSTGDDPGVEELRFVSPHLLAEYLPTPSLGEPLRWFLDHPDEPARYWFYPEYTSG
jgi:ADP-ribose pyrophosphatase YjhB (NUDIX family)